VITAYYVGARPSPLGEGLLSVFSVGARPEAERTLRRIRAAWLGWLRRLAISMTLIGALLYLALGMIVGLPFALVFAALSACAGGGAVSRSARQWRTSGRLRPHNLTDPSWSRSR
jgi:predicted PurR-regulated permease PerM